MINIALCDDEPIMLENLFNVVAKYMKSKNVEFTLDMFESGEDLIETGIRKKIYDIVFLDIEMKEMNGLEAAEWLHKLNKQSEIIFVTSYVQYTVEAIKLSAFRYIVKKKDALEQGVYEALDAYLKKEEEIEEAEKYSFAEADIVLVPSNIIYIESVLHDLKFHIQSDQYQELTLKRVTLNNWEEERAGKGFVRIHQSFIVNIRYVYSYNSKEVVLLDGTVLAISKLKRAGVCQLFRECGIQKQKR